MAAIDGRALASRLTVEPEDAPGAPRGEHPIVMSDQLPHSRVARGGRDIRRAWLAAPTDRYPHGVLGDDLEAGALAVETADGRTLLARLPDDRVFEDLEPRLADLDRDGVDEIIVVESSRRAGARLAVWGIVEGRLARKAASDEIGRPFRWLNPVGVGDFSGDGRSAVAVVETPHIGGVVKIYRVEADRLVLVARRRGYSTHVLGSTELRLGRVFRSAAKDALLLPSQARDELAVIALGVDGLREIARVRLPGQVVEPLEPLGPSAWRTRLAGGIAVRIRFEP